MQDTSRLERKVVKSLLHQLRNERKEALKQKVLAWGLSLSGGGLLGLSFVSAGDVGGDAVWFWGFGALGGVMAGVSVLFFASYTQWPIIKKFMNLEALEDAHESQGFERPG